jgi:hypothetical protein
MNTFPKILTAAPHSIKLLVALLFIGAGILEFGIGEEEEKKKLPIFYCTVVSVYEAFDSYGPPEKSDEITMDPNQLENVKEKLEFKSKLRVSKKGGHERAYIPLQGPFKLVKKDFSHIEPSISFPNGSFSMKFVSTASDDHEDKVTLSIHGDSKGCTVYIVGESFGFINGVAVLKGVAK